MFTHIVQMNIKLVIEGSRVNAIKRILRPYMDALISLGVVEEVQGIRNSSKFKICRDTDSLAITEQLRRGIVPLDSKITHQTPVLCGNDMNELVSLNHFLAIY